MKLDNKDCFAKKHDYFYSLSLSVSVSMSMSLSLTHTHAHNGHFFFQVDPMHNPLACNEAKYSGGKMESLYDKSVCCIISRHVTSRMWSPVHTKSQNFEFTAAVKGSFPEKKCSTKAVSPELVKQSQKHCCSSNNLAKKAFVYPYRSPPFSYWHRGLRRCYA